MHRPKNRLSSLPSLKGGAGLALRRKRVTVVGMGKSGAAAVSLLAREGAETLVVDEIQKEIPPALGTMASVRFHLGPFREEDFLRSDLIVVSPGVPLQHLPMGKLKATGIPVIGELELAASFLSAPVIAVTGTNGKSTTTTLVGEILKGWGWQVFVGGNLGTPLSEAVSSPWDFIVVEASSFQLETIEAFRPRIAALLNVTPDHLDRYPDLPAYQKAKWRIFENQSDEDHAVINHDDPLTRPPFLKKPPVFFSRSIVPSRGIYLRDGEIFSNVWGEPEPIIRLDALKLKGAHNIENVMAAAAMTLLCGCSVEGIRRVLIDFKGLPHRMEFVREVRGVKYINDSKGTNVGAVLKSLEGPASPVIWIAGGKDKESDFTPLRDIASKKVKRLILIGEAREKMARCFAGVVALERADSMEEAVEKGASLAAPGDMVLLSPACASFDMFRDYQDRGDVFKRAVRGLPD